MSLFLLLPLCFAQCNNDDNGEPANKDDNFNLFSIEKDKELGRKFSNQIASDSSQYELLDSAKYPEPYQYLYQIRNTIFQKAEIQYENEFKWQMRIIRNDSTLNAFCTPGGYIYFYTGLIRYLENEADFAGVMGHEIAHAAERHSTEQLTKQYGRSLLISIVFGDNPGQLVKIASSLASLKFSREDEKEADDKGVTYLNPTKYDARGVAGFFEKLADANQGSRPPQFLSTHPNPENRVENIKEKWRELGSKEGKYFPERYQEFKNSLP